MALGAFVAVVAVVTFFSPFWLPSNIEQLTGMGSILSLVAPTVLLPMMALTNLFLPKMAKKLI